MSVKHIRPAFAEVFGVAFLFFGCLCLKPTVCGQLSTASVNGTVSDSSGAVITEATVTLNNVDTGVQRTAVTNNVGIYVFLNIAPGTYTLQASREGFRTSAIEPFKLVVNQTATFNFNLEIGAVTESVTVEAIGAEIQSSTAELGAAVTDRQVVDLPLNGRNFTQLLSLTPGVAPVSVSQNRGGWTAAPVGQFVFPSVNGQTNRSNFFMMDGGHNHLVYVSTYAVPPIIDAIQEFKVQSHNDQAEFGGATGGIINVVTKSGTNEFHGTAWELLRNNALDARNFFLPQVTPFRQNMFGATVGGPIVRNKTFFFFGYQGFEFRRAAETFFRVPTDANLRGDLSDIPEQIFNPFTTREDPVNSGQFIRDPFPNNQIPSNMLDPGMVLYAQETLPRPVATGLADRNALDTTTFKQEQGEWTARVDQMAGDKDFFWARWSIRRQDTDSSGGRQALKNLNQNRARQIGASWVRTISPTTVVQAQFADILVNNPFGTLFRNLPGDFAQRVGLSPEFAGGFIGIETLIPGFNVADFFSGGEGGILGSKPADISQFKGSASLIRGNHTIKFGGEVNSTRHFNDVTQIGVNFSPFQTANLQSPKGTGSALASYLLNVPETANRRNTHDSTRWGGVIGFFVQDQWRATPKLTVNLGLRYDRTFRPPYGEDKEGNIFVGSLDLNRGVYVLQDVPPPCAVSGGQPCIPTPDGSLPEHVEVDPRRKIYHDWTDNWQPRFGLAYRLSDRTALRGSYGIYFESWAALTQSAQNYAGSWPTVALQLAQNLNNPTSEQPTPSIKATNPFLEGLFPAPTPFNQVIWYMDPLHKNAYSMQWNFGLQHQLDSATVVSANYVGSGTRRLNLGGYYNTALTPGPGDPQSRAPFDYILPTFYDRSWGRGNYNALQFLLDRKYSNDLAYMVSYTWSKAIDIGCSGWFGVEGCSVQDPYNFNRDRSVAGFDLTHVLSVNWVYSLPFGPGKALSPENRVLSHIIGNWQVNGILLLSSGQPYNPVIAGDIANTGNTFNYMRPNVVGDPALSNPTPERWFNQGAFAVPAPFTFGSAGRHLLRSDGLANLDFSVFRQFRIAEGKRLEFRAEFFNAFNSPQFAIPVNNQSFATFGRVLSTANAARQVQLGLKLIF